MSEEIFRKETSREEPIQKPSVGAFAVRDYPEEWLNREREVSQRALREQFQEVLAGWHGLD